MPQIRHDALREFGFADALDTQQQIVEAAVAAECALRRQVHVRRHPQPVQARRRSAECLKDVLQGLGPEDLQGWSAGVDEPGSGVCDEARVMGLSLLLSRRRQVCRWPRLERPIKLMPGIQAAVPLPSQLLPLHFAPKLYLKPDLAEICGEREREQKFKS